MHQFSFGKHSYAYPLRWPIIRLFFSVGGLTYAQFLKYLIVTNARKILIILDNVYLLCTTKFDFEYKSTSVLRALGLVFLCLFYYKCFCTQRQYYVAPYYYRPHIILQIHNSLINKQSVLRCPPCAYTVLSHPPLPLLLSIAPPGLYIAPVVRVSLTPRPCDISHSVFITVNQTPISTDSVITSFCPPNKAVVV